jgi:serine/threonine protein kinase/Tfp pilus assembly protein PilF
MIGQVISHYKIIEKLGEGGMGVVYKAHDTKLDRFVALKFLPPHISANEETKARFLQEARAASALNHPNVCTIYGIEEIEGRQHIEMELVDGTTLRDKLHRGPLPLMEASAYAIQIGEALREAHHHGIVHRDIKPDNIMVNSKDQVKVMDFGLAKLKGEIGLTGAVATVGTIAYMSPEQIQGIGVDHRTDIWSWGVVFHEMITGQLPFRGEHQAAMMYSIANEEPLLATSSTTIPAKVRSLINRALEKDQTRRYQNIDDMLADLQSSHSTISLRSVEKTVAVLPFENISPDKENEFFSDGLTEEIIATLSKIKTIKVVSRTSIIQYKGTNKPLRQIASELRVQYVLEGSVRKHGGDLRITAQLIDAVQDVHVWAENYRGTIKDVFDIQEQVAGEIAKSLEVQLSPREERDLKKRATEDPEAYQLYLKGRFFWNRRTEEGVKSGLAYFKQAIEKDPSYALAYHGLADAYNILGFYTYVSPKESFPLAKAAAEKALEIDDSLGEAYSSLAYALHYYYWDWEGSERNYRKSIELKDRYFTAHHFYANYLVSMSRFEEGVREFNRAQDLDPFALIASAGKGWLYNQWRKYDDAVAQLTKTLILDKNFLLGHLWLGISYSRKGLFAEAIKELKHSVDLSDTSVIALASLAHTYMISGDIENGEKILRDLDAQSHTRYVSSYYRVVICAARGATDEAFEWLNKAYEERSHMLVFLSVDPDLDPLRADPRFEVLRKKVGLVN